MRNGRERTPKKNRRSSETQPRGKAVPARVLGITPEPILVPEAPYELTSGFRPNVVFPTGLAMEGDEALVYYGAADSVICVATASVDEVLAAIEPATAEPTELAARAAAVATPEPATG